MFRVVIPARLGSTRLPRKVILDLNGKPVLQHVYERACRSEASAVIVATDDEEVRALANGFADRVCITRADHPSGTSRLAEVVEQLGLEDDDVIVNVQGDEPAIPPELINQVALSLIESTADMATLSAPLSSLEEISNPNVVKVVTNKQGAALYFSRATIPWDRDHLPEQLEQGFLAAGSWQRHIGIYAYRCGLLRQFPLLEPAPMEQLESLEQLRLLWHGFSIQVSRVDQVPLHGVDTLDDLEHLREVLKN